MPTVNHSIFPIELQNLLVKSEIEWDGSINITSIDYYGDDAKIELSFNDDRRGRLKQLWEIQLSGIREERIVRQPADTMIAYSEHFLIDEQQGNTIELYVKAKPSQTGDAFMEVYQYFYRTFQGFIPFEKYLNVKSTGADSSFDKDLGLFAHGPKFIMSEIKSILDSNGYSSYLAMERENTIQSETGWVKDDLNLFALIIGDSFFVAETMSFQRI